MGNSNSPETMSDFAQRGLSLTDLQERMVCSKCGMRKPSFTGYLQHD